jgi:NhaA family Na+:H+ antiporter
MGLKEVRSTVLTPEEEAIIVTFVMGKPLGVALFSFLAAKLHIGIRPAGLSWSLLIAGSLSTGIGFTLALFIAELAFEVDLLNAVKLGVLGASVISAAAGFLALAWLTPRGER